MTRRTTGLGALRLAPPWGVLLLCACAWLAGHPRTAAAAELVREAYYWYAPEHEKYSRTQFLSQPDFRSSPVQINRTQRFQFLSGSRGWALLEFEGGTRAFIHLRLLRLLMWDSAASDPWYEFERASVFPEEPKKIEERLEPASAEPAPVDSKVPAWKRYKDGWNINQGRQPSAVGTDSEASSPYAPEKKRSKHPLLPPIGSQPQTESIEPPAPDGAAR